MSWEHAVADSGGRRTQGDHGYKQLARGRWSPGILPSQLPFSCHFPLTASYSPRTQTSRPALGGGQLQPVHGGAAETPGLPPPPLSSIGAAALNQRGLGGLSGRSYHSQPSPPQPTSATVLFPSQNLSVRGFSVFPPCTTPTPNQRGLSSQENVVSRQA